MARHNKYAVQIDGVLLGGITEQDLMAGSEFTREVTSGDIFPRQLALTAQNPKGSFTTLAVRQALAALDADTLHLPCATALRMYARKHEEGGGRAAGANHRSYTLAKVLIVPTTLSAEHQQNATLALDVTVGYDGVNAPVVPADSVSLPGSLTDPERYTLGPIIVGGVTLTKKASVSLDFGLTVAADAADSDLWPTELSLEQGQPTVTLRGFNPLWFATSGAIPLTGAAAGHANTKIYLRKRSGSGFVPDGTAEHVLLTVAGVVTPEDLYRAGERGETTLTLPLVHDGTNPPIVINAGVAIVV